MRAVDLIRKKRDGGTLTTEEIAFLVGGIESGHVADYQWSAMLMAIKPARIGSMKPKAAPPICLNSAA